MNNIVINENQKGLLFKNGRYIKMLNAGKYHSLFGREFEILDIGLPIVSHKIGLDELLKDKGVASVVSVTEVGDEELALHYVNGKFSSVLPRGKHAFFSDTDKHEFKIVDISTPTVADSVPKYIFAKIPEYYYVKAEVKEYERARLYFDKKLVKVLDPGTYYFWRTAVKVEVDIVDTRLLQMNILGQEILTADKVSLRINFVLSYRIKDIIRIATEIDSFEEQLHVTAQLALRDYVGKYKLDEILENKEQMSKYVFDKLKAKEGDLFIEIHDAGIKDIILPGEIRDIMNSVLAATKRAEANVISRREEVASTRSLLNTARLMDENKTLYRLKELEYIERISENVGNINLTLGNNILTALSSVFGKDTT